MTRFCSHGANRRSYLSPLMVGVLLAWSLPAASMNLLQAYELAKVQDANILASRAAAVAGRERLPQADSQLLPNVSLSASRFNNELSSTTANFLGEPQTTDTRYGSSNQSLTIRQPLLRPYLFAQSRQATAQVAEAEGNLETDEQNLAVRVSGAYLDALLTYEQLALIQAQRTTYTTQLDSARKSFAAGAGTRTDVDEAQARLDMNTAQEIEARQNVGFTLKQLELLVNQPVDSLARLDVSKLNLQDPEFGDVSLWLERAEKNSPQLQILLAQQEIARQEIDKARSGHFPTVDAIAQWTRSESENVTNVNSRYTNASIGVQLSIPIYSGGYVNSTMRSAVALLERAQQALEAGRRDLQMKVHREFRNVTENVYKIKALEQALRSADQLVLSSSKSLQAGSRTVLDVLNAQQQRLAVQRDLAQAQFVHLLSKVRLLALVGAADVSAIATINSALQ